MEPGASHRLGEGLYHLSYMLLQFSFYILISLYDFILANSISYKADFMPSQKAIWLS